MPTFRLFINSIAILFAFLSLIASLLYFTLLHRADSANVETREFAEAQIGGKVLEQTSALLGTRSSLLVCLNGKVKEVIVDKDLWTGKYFVQSTKDFPPTIHCSKN